MQSYKFLTNAEQQEILDMVKVIQEEDRAKERQKKSKEKFFVKRLSLVGDLNITCGHCRTCGDIGSRCQTCGRVL